MNLRVNVLMNLLLDKVADSSLLHAPRKTKQLNSNNSKGTNSSCVCSLTTL